MWKTFSRLFADRPTYDRWYAPDTWRANQERSDRSPYRASHRDLYRRSRHL